MAVRELTPEEQYQAKREEEEEHKRTVEAVERKLEHELKVSKLKFATQPRYKSIERIFISLTKAFALPVAIICITVLAARGKDVPPALIKFITI